MCGKFGTNEVESMQNMMSMAVYFVIADTFDVDIETGAAFGGLGCG